MNTASSSQVETNHPPKQRGYRFWIGCFVIIFGLPLLLYYGYCWGLWGRSSLLLQYLFQCSCPPASEEARYSEEVDVIISACRYGSSTLSPSGRLLAVYEKEPVNASPYLLDLQTGEIIPFPLPEKRGFYFLTDNLLFVSIRYGDQEYILDRTTGSQYPIRRYLSVYPGTYVGGDADLNLLAEALRQAKFIFFRDYDDTIIALDPDFPALAEKNFTIDRFDIPGENPNRTDLFLKENSIVYKTILPDFPDEAISPDTRFVARPDGIYLFGTGQKIVESYSPTRFYRVYGGKYFDLRGWTYDSRAVVYSELSDPCVIETGFFIFDDPYCFIKVPQPVIKLKVPEEYLQPSQSP
jgi:hypothetical protein